MIRWLRRALAVLTTLVLLVLAAVAGLVWLTLPGGDVTAAIPGLSAPVAIDLDADGIPRIHAGNEADAAAALGFLHARERLFQMDLMRRVASGELAEVFGADALPTDRMMRTLGLRVRAVADLPLLPADTRALLEAYARGVNAWIAAHGRLSAAEFVVLGTPRPWTPVDSLLWGKTMALYLSGNWREERARLVLDAKFPAAEVDELWPDGGGGGHPEAALAPDPSLQFAVDRPVLASMAARLAAVVPEFPAPFTLPDSASNGWAVDGTHSATGAPLLAGDPHLGYGFPSVWYLARIETPGHVLAGATAPGLPFLVLGHNGHVAWTFTTTGADVQDLFVETPAGDDRYKTPDGTQPFTLREESIRVRGAPDELLTIRETRHGPVISDLVDPTGPVLALAAAELQPADTAAAGLLALNRATDVAAAGAAAAQITSPIQNMTVADGHTIALFVTGRIPIRAAGDGSRAAPGADGSHDWVGWASGDRLPHYVSPASGRLVNANERVAPPDFPVFLGRSWYDDFRAQRIHALLAASDRHSTGSFAAIQLDIVDLAARDLLPTLRALPAEMLPPGSTARAAFALLAGWDGVTARDGPQALIFNAWAQRFRSSLLDHLGVPPAGRAAVAPWPQLLHHAFSPAGAHWCGGDCRQMLADSLVRSMPDLVARFGPDPALWRWGAAHQAVFAHPVLRLLPALGALTEARIETPGDDSTIDRGGLAQGTYESVHGPEFRGVYDLADLNRSLFVMAPGQSGNPFSHLARNFLQRWRDGASVTLAPDAPRIAAVITLNPGPAP
jgi:penicillin amidase